MRYIVVVRVTLSGSLLSALSLLLSTWKRFRFGLYFYSYYYLYMFHLLPLIHSAVNWIDGRENVVRLSDVDAIDYVKSANKNLYERRGDIGGGGWFVI